MTIKSNLEFILKAKGMTQAQLAATMGFTAQNLSYLMKGNITLDKMEKIARTLGVAVSDLVADPPLSARRAFYQKGEPTHAEIDCPACGKHLKITLEE